MFSGARCFVLTVVVAALLSPARGAETVLRIDTFRPTVNDPLVEEVFVDYFFPPRDDPPPFEEPLINAFHIELTTDAAGEGVTLGPPSYPTHSPFALPGATLVDEGSTPQRIRVGAALADPAAAVPLAKEATFVQFQIHVPPGFSRQFFDVFFDSSTTRLTGPDGAIPVELAGRNYESIDYLPEPGGLLALAGAVGWLVTGRGFSRRRLRQ